MAEEKKVVIDNEGDESEEINLEEEKSTAEIDENILKLETEIENLKTEIKTKDERFLRLQADFDNFRKRVAREKSEFATIIEQAFLKDLLPLLDNLDRASAAAENAEDSDVETMRKGIELIKTEAISVMSKHGLEPIDTQDKTFDPNFHQAVGRIQDDTKPDGQIAAELQRGYTASGMVIRPSMVHVVSNS